MYSRNVEADDGTLRTVLDFGVSGNLWHGVLVMYDRQSGSFWTQLDGRSIEGDYAGTRLEHVASTFTTWERWKAAHPDTEVLFKPEDERGQGESNYASYFADPDRLFLDRLGEGLGGSVGPKTTVHGVVIGETAWAVTEELVAADGAVTFGAAGELVTLHYDPDTERVRGVARSRGGDDQGRSVRVDRAFWYAWSRSHPGSRIMTR
ncbi:MAG: DUF3179 domain-containing protein [bacterium]|nr:DUF3179 domain-containing protein [bacterium]